MATVTSAGRLLAKGTARVRQVGGDVGPSPIPATRCRQSDKSGVGGPGGHSRSRAPTPGSMFAAKKGDVPVTCKPEAADKTGKTTHRLSGSVWLATNFAISMQQFVPVVEALSAEHEAMRRLKDLLCSRGLEEAATQVRMATESAAMNAGCAKSDVGHVFPVKVAVPVNVAIRGIMHLESFEVKQPCTGPAELFEVPANYSWTSRHESQKTLTRSKKRMLMANLAMI
eukprot:gnl/TRDRNA2_/TRDRNA2_163855_c2_seq2.p1 gnl/TRDRNA2_/TRDRNA2_163855_c2~~gnl/TRDRNA2_/TRDRNA2_163855_c2_seq2.p1  ORF type:complete len:227 (+),score=40.62 gnl/TRDRNA2_/TRDRNA2_163855_c2_seq2:394-1074(+)